MAKKKKATLNPLAGRLAKAGRISPKALKRLKLKTPKIAVALKPKRGSAIAVAAPRGGVAKGMAGM